MTSKECRKHFQNAQKSLHILIQTFGQEVVMKRVRDVICNCYDLIEKDKSCFAS